MGEPIVVHDQVFETKKALEEKLREILRGAELGVELDEPWHSFLLCVLFRHPDAVKKLGPGVNAFRVTTTKYKNRCFEIVRVDGSTEEFSFVRCVKGGGDLDGDGDAVGSGEAS